MDGKQIKRFEVKVTQYVTIDLDESKFTDKFLDNYKRINQNCQTIEDHVKYFAQLVARGIIKPYKNNVVEGYGNLKNDFGIIMTLDGWSQTEEIISSGEI